MLTKKKPTRRKLLHQILLAGGTLALGPVVWMDEAAAVGKSTVTKTERGKRGTTIYTELVNAPFPYGGKPYKDATTIVYVPHHYRLPKDKKIDIVVHFHGHGTNARRAMKDHQLREQFAESKQNALLIIPQGPMNARDGSGGKLGEKGGLLRFLTDLRKTLGQPKATRALGRAGVGHRRARIGRVALSAHSGGYHVAARCVKHGGFNVNEVYLFDSLYGDVGDFRDWVLAGKRYKDHRRHKLICYYGGARVKQQTMKLKGQLESAGIKVLHEEREGQLSRADFTTGRVVMVRTRVGHGGVASKNNALRDCLFASCFKRRVKDGWFDRSHKPRQIDSRK